MTTLFFCEKYPDYICEGLSFKDGTFRTNVPAEIEKIRKCPIYRGYIKEAEVKDVVQSSPSLINKVSPKEIKELEKEAVVRRKAKRGKARQGVITTEHLKRQI